MGLIATAEGVEDVETFELLRDLGCDDAQGFLIGKPMEGPRLTGWLRSYVPPARAAEAEEAEEADRGQLVPLRPSAAAA